MFNSLFLRTTLLGGALVLPFACVAPAAPQTAPANADVATLLSLPAAPVINADSRDWPKTGVQSLQGPDGSATFQIAGDATNFYALVQVKDKSPLRNSATRPEESWKGGDAIAFYSLPGFNTPQLAARRGENGETVRDELPLAQEP